MATWKGKKWMGRSYPAGTRVQHRSGYIVVKVVSDDGEEKMMAESRRVWELRRGPLEPGDRVFHIDGDRTHNDIKNLAMVHFNQTKFVVLQNSKILYLPPSNPKYTSLIPSIKTLDKKTGKVLADS